MKVFAKENFKTTRIKSGFSLSGLADTLEMSKQALGQIERRSNGVAPENARRIVELFGVEFDDVFELIERVGSDGKTK